MNAIQMQLSFFNDNTEEGLIRQELIITISEMKKIQRSLFAKVGSQNKELDNLKAELASVKQHLGMELHRDEPLFIYNKRGT